MNWAMARSSRASGPHMTAKRDFASFAARSMSSRPRPAPAALDVLGEDLRDELGAALLGERTLDLVGSLANEPQIEHGTTGLRPGWCFRPRRWRSSRPCRRRRGR